MPCGCQRKPIICCPDTTTCCPNPDTAEILITRGRYRDRCYTPRNSSGSARIGNDSRGSSRCGADELPGPSFSSESRSTHCYCLEGIVRSNGLVVGDKFPGVSTVVILLLCQSINVIMRTEEVIEPIMYRERIRKRFRR